MVAPVVVPSIVKPSRCSGIDLPAISVLLPPMILQILIVPSTIDTTTTLISNFFPSCYPPTSLLFAKIFAHGSMAGRAFGSAIVYGPCAWRANHVAVFLHKMTG